MDLKNQREPLLVILSSVGLLILLSFYLEFRKPADDPNVITHTEDLKHLNGLLIPTRNSIPSRFVGDSRFYGLGSNEGCFGTGITFTDQLGAYYCYRFFDQDSVDKYDPTSKSDYTLDNADTLIFQANSYSSDHLQSSISFSIEDYTQALENSSLEYTEQQFKYGNQIGSLIRHKLPPTKRSPKPRSVSKLFWNEANAHYSIRWSTPNPLERSPQDIINILHTMRRSTDGSLSKTSDYTNAAYFIGEPIQIKSWSSLDSDSRNETIVDERLLLP